MNFQNGLWWFDGRVFASILEVKGLNLTNGVFVVNSNKLIEYSFMWFLRVGAYLCWLHALCTYVMFLTYHR